ncbi:MAG: FkbM family methyltransferase, partial [Deltaproteobacteria bacterium]|nr:FkbM family methyltransferase [Deltaproteobacteria bacterium]
VQATAAADIFADILELDFPDHTVDEIRLHHVFEHFDRSRALALLIRWHSWLKVKGKLHIETPDIIGSARTLLSEMSYKTKQAVLRHAFGSHEAYWAYHLDGWYKEKFEHILSKLGFTVQCQNVQWKGDPWLSNVHAIALKKGHISQNDLLKCADEILLDSMVADVPGERSMHNVWCRMIRDELQKNRKDSEFPPFPQVDLSGLTIHTDSPQFDQHGYDDIEFSRNGELNVLKEIVKQDGIIFDVGANKGHWSKLALGLNPRARIIAFEPVPETFVVLQENLTAPNVRLHNLAVSGDNQDKTFYHWDDSFETGELSSLYRRLEIEKKMNASVKPIKVKSRCLDTFCFEHEIQKIDFLKIDTEGAELDVLRGATNLLELKHIRVLQFEYGGTYLDAHITLRQIYNLLRHYGYTIYRIIPDGLLYIPIWRDVLENYRYANYLAVASSAIPSAAEVRQTHVKEAEISSPVQTETMTAVVFSKDRAMQLDASLRSLIQHCRDLQDLKVKVIYKTSNERNHQQYEKLKRTYPPMEFIPERDFKTDFLNALYPYHYVLFLVDDNLFIRDFRLTDLVAYLEKYQQAIGFSLRLGKNTTFCYMQNKNQKLPDFNAVGKGVLKYNWTKEELDFGYPLEVSSSLYSIGDILPILREGDFKNPNTLEALLDAGKSFFKNAENELLCFETSAAFCNPANMVQNLWNNKAGHNNQYSPDALADLFEKGYRIDLEKFSEFIPNSCHQEVEFQFTEPSGQTIHQSGVASLVSIIILSYNGLDHIKACLESIRRNTTQTYEIIVVDNAKQDGSVEYLRTIKDIVLIENPENVGPAVSRAQAMAVAKGNYIVFLDDDTLVPQDWLSKFISIVEEHPEIGMIGPVSNYASGLQVVENGSYGTVEELDRIAREHYQAHRGKFTIVPRLVSFCLFITRSVVEKIGTFDHRFGLFGFEDDDYALRAFLAGLNPTIAHEIFIHHTGGPQGRGNVVYNDRLQKAWTIYKEKWGINPKIEYGQPYDSTPIISQSFDRNKHFVPLPDKQKINELIHQNQTGSPGKDCTPVTETTLIASGLTSIILPINSFNGKLRRCLESIETQITEPHEIILAELGVLSKPAWLNHCVNKNTPLKRIGVPKNSNYAERLNKALEKITGQYVLILDPNSIVLEGAFGRMVESLNRNPKFGITVPLFNQAIGSQQIPGVQHLSFKDYSDYASTFSRRNRHRFAMTFEIDHLCVLIKREVIEAVGPFNQKIQPSFFVLNDYRLRALVIGYQTIMAADTCMYINQDDQRRVGSDKVFHNQWDIFDPQSEKGKKISPFVAIKNARDDYSKGLFDKSVQAIIEGIKYTPEDEELYYCLAEILFQEKSFQEVIETLQAMPQDGKDKARTLAILGYSNFYLGHLEEAEVFGNRAISLFGNSSEVLNLKGLIALKREDRIGAEKLFYQAIELNPCVADPYVNLGVMKWHNNEKEEGLDFIEKGFILSPKTGDFSATYQSAVTSLNQFSRAETVAREALGLFPNNKILSFLLVDILLQQQKNSEAMKEIEKALLAFGINEDILSAAKTVREKIGPLTIDQNKKGTGTLSICMIVKNEATYMARCLASLKPVADEIIVVDTGSTDQTKEIATAFGAQVFDFPWTNDFSEARNISLEKAQGDWILVHDADEVLSLLDYEKFKHLIRQKHSKPIAYDLITRNYIMEPAIDGWTANIGEYREEESGSGWFPSNKVRLFKNDSRIRFCNPVHEILEISIKQAGIDIKPCNIPIHHYGKLPTKTNEKKGDIYYLLGKRKLELMGDIPIAHREMAIQAEELGKHEEAITHWQAYARAIPDNALAHFNMASIYFEMGEFTRALEVAEKALEIDSQAKETILTYATVSLCAGDPIEAEKKLEGLLERVKNYPPAQVALAASYCITGKKEEGVTLMKKMKRKGYNYDPAMESLSKKLLLAGRTELAMNLLESMLAWDAEKQKTLALLEECRTASGCSPA